MATLLVWTRTIYTIHVRCAYTLIKAHFSLQLLQTDGRIMPWIQSKWLMNSNWIQTTINSLASATVSVLHPCMLQCSIQWEKAWHVYIRILCEYYYPGTFDGLCVIEPVLSSVMYDGEIKEQFPVLASRKRRDEWPSFEECHKSLASRGFFKLLHPEVLELYVVSSVHLY